LRTASWRAAIAASCRVALKKAGTCASTRGRGWPRSGAKPAWFGLTSTLPCLVCRDVAPTFTLS
jgi:hypothetical protein